MKTIESYEREWESNAVKDPYWSVLSASKYKDTDWGREEFFKTGQEEIVRLRKFIQELSFTIPFEGVALDFGCGVGRLSQALSCHFSQVIGVDISKKMVEEARASAKNSNIYFKHNPKDDLSLLESDSVDFIYSNIVLQHIGNHQQRKYLTEFSRVLKPGGWMIIQIPSAFICGVTRKIRRRIGRLLPYGAKRFLLRHLFQNHDRAVKDFVFEVNSLPQAEVEERLIACGLQVKHIAFTNSCEPDFCGQLQFFSAKEAQAKGEFLSPMYFVYKPA